MKRERDRFYRDLRDRRAKTSSLMDVCHVNRITTGWSLSAFRPHGLWTRLPLPRPAITRWPRDKLLVHGVQWHPELHYRRRKKKVCAWWIPIGCVMNSFESSKRRREGRGEEGLPRSTNGRNLRLRGASSFRTVVFNFLPIGDDFNFLFFFFFLKSILLPYIYIYSINKRAVFLFLY